MSSWATRKADERKFEARNRVGSKVHGVIKCIFVHIFRKIAQSMKMTKYMHILNLQSLYSSSISL